jgi:hypothetical protein
MLTVEREKEIREAYAGLENSSVAPELLAGKTSQSWRDG